DHVGWVELLKKQKISVVYVDAFWAPHHGNKKGVIPWLNEWGSRTRLKAHGELKRGNRILVDRSGADQPPRFAQFALLLIPKRNREHLVGDLDEEYRTIALPQQGRFWARVWYWEQAVLALGFYLWPLLKRVLGLAAIWRVIGR